MPIKPAAECKYAEVDQIKEIHEQVNLTYVGPSVETSGANFGATMMLDAAGTSDACAAMADASRAHFGPVHHWTTAEEFVCSLTRTGKSGDVLVNYYAPNRIDRILG